MYSLQGRLYKPWKQVGLSSKKWRTPIRLINTSCRKLRNDQEYDVGSKYTKNDKSEDSAPRKKNGPKFAEYTRLNTARSQVLMEIENDKNVKWPKPLRTEGERKNLQLYCRFHKDNRHNTDDYRQLKDEIEFLIQKGKLAKYTKKKLWKQQPWEIRSRWLR